MSLFEAVAPPVELTNATDQLVVVAPHPDDEVLACGLLIASAVEADIPVLVVAVTDGEAAYPDHDPDELAATRRQEQLDALRVLGVGADRVHRLGIPDGGIATHVDALAAAIARRCTTRTLLVAPSMHDWHADHEACGAAASAAAGASGALHWSWLFWAHLHPERLVASEPSLLRHRASARLRDARARAVACHRSQFERPMSGGEPILSPATIRHLAQPVEIYVDESR